MKKSDNSPQLPWIILIMAFVLLLVVFVAVKDDPYSLNHRPAKRQTDDDETAHKFRLEWRKP